MKSTTNFHRHDLIYVMATLHSLEYELAIVSLTLLDEACPARVQLVHVNAQVKTSTKLAQLPRAKQEISEHLSLTANLE